MLEARRSISREKQVFSVGFSLTFTKFLRKSKNHKILVYEVFSLLLQPPQCIAQVGTYWNVELIQERKASKCN